jgi:hypothetical protein
MKPAEPLGRFLKEIKMRNDRIFGILCLSLHIICYGVVAGLMIVSG